MAETKDATQNDPPIPFPLLAAAYLLFFCLEGILAVEVRSVSFFSDSIVFLEAASVSVLLSPGLTWSLPGREAFARFARTLILIPTCFMFWMIAANYYGAEIPSAAPMGTIGALLLLTNIACLTCAETGHVCVSGGPVLACSKSCNHECRDHHCCIADVGVRDDVAGRPGRLGDFIRECGRRGARLAHCAATSHSTNLNVQTDVRSYSSTRGMSFALRCLVVILQRDEEALQPPQRPKRHDQDQRNPKRRVNPIRRLIFDLGNEGGDDDDGTGDHDDEYGGPVADVREGEIQTA